MNLIWALGKASRRESGTASANRSSSFWAISRVKLAYELALRRMFKCKLFVFSIM
jgi:hypothetical protein